MKKNKFQTNEQVRQYLAYMMPVKKYHTGYSNNPITKTEMLLYIASYIAHRGGLMMQTMSKLDNHRIGKIQIDYKEVVALRNRLGEYKIEREHYQQSLDASLFEDAEYVKNFFNKILNN